MPSVGTRRSDTKVLSSLKRTTPGRSPIERHHACPPQGVHSITGPNFGRFDVTGINLSQDPTGLVYQVTSLSSLTFANLGTGTVYGSRIYTAADEAMTLPIALDADALTAIGNGGITFSVSGRVISGTTLPLTFGPTAPDEFAFGGTEGAQVLSITTVPVPGPIAGAGLPSLILAVGGLLAWWRRSRKIG
jgi:hypothetical protein